MNIKLRIFTQLAVITLLISSATALQAQLRPYRVTDNQVQAIIDKLETDTDAFTTEMNRGTANTSVTTMLRDFEDSTDRLKDNFTSRRSSSADVQDVINRSFPITNYIRTNRISMRSDDLWSTVKSDINTLAGYYNIIVNWTSNTDPVGGTATYTATPRQMRVLFNRIKQRSLAFRQSYERWSNQYDRPTNPNASYDLSQELTAFDLAVNEVSRRYSNGADVQDVFNAATPIDQFVARNRGNVDMRTKWNLVRTDLNTLAGYYSMRWDWDNGGTYGGGYGNGTGYGRGSLDSRLTGTYRLNTARSDNVSTIVDRAIVNANYETSRRDRVRRNLERRLTAPDTLVLEMRNSQLTLAGRNGQTVTLDANGIAQTETSPNGRAVTTKVTATDRDVTINYEGDRMNEYYVSFRPIAAGQLQVVRRVYLEDQNQTVTATSVYDKTSPTPQWTTNTVGSNNTPLGQNVNGYVIPNNTTIIATLDTPLSTRTARDGDRFTMTVSSPSVYSGAIIEGTVTGQRSGVVTGRANMSLNFDTIRMRGDNRIYNFAGIVDQVRNTNGDVLNVNNEGVVRDSSQTNRTVTRAGIGALLGGIIGAIAGGGSGAAIGAGVGAGAGAGTVILQGRDNLELQAGSEFSITATAPANVGQIR
jgi:hypothetical protein